MLASQRGGLYTRQPSTTRAGRQEGISRRAISARAYDPKKTAVVLIEYQNDFTTPGGKLHDAVKGVMASSKMLDNTLATVKAARDKGALIVHAPIVFSDSYQEMSDSIFGILANVKATGAFKKSEWGGAIVDSLKPQSGDMVVEGKRGLCGFASTNLDWILRQRGIKTVALGGFLTNCCVESTMRGAYEKGYEVVTLTDCVAATSEEEQAAAIKFTYPMFSKPTPSSKFLADPGGYDSDVVNAQVADKAASTFWSYDSESKGTLDRADLMSALADMGALQGLPPKMIADLLALEAPSNREKRFTLHEFLTMYMRLAQQQAKMAREGRPKPSSQTREPPPGAESNPHLRQVYGAYCQYARGTSRMGMNESAPTMTAQQLHRLMQDIGLTGEGGPLYSSSVDIAYVRCKAPGSHRLSFPQWLRSLCVLSDESGWDLFQIMAEHSQRLGTKNIPPPVDPATMLPPKAGTPLPQLGPALPPAASSSPPPRAPSSAANSVIDGGDSASLWAQTMPAGGGNGVLRRPTSAMSSQRPPRFNNLVAGSDPSLRGGMDQMNGLGLGPEGSSWTALELGQLDPTCLPPWLTQVLERLQYMEARAQAEREGKPPPCCPMSARGPRAASEELAGLQQRLQAAEQAAAATAAALGATPPPGSELAAALATLPPWLQQGLKEQAEGGVGGGARAGQAEKQRLLATEQTAAAVAAALGAVPPPGSDLAGALAGLPPWLQQGLRDQLGPGAAPRGRQSDRHRLLAAEQAAAAAVVASLGATPQPGSDLAAALADLPPWLQQALHEQRTTNGNPRQQADRLAELEKQLEAQQGLIETQRAQADALAARLAQLEAAQRAGSAGGGAGAVGPDAAAAAAAAAYAAGGNFEARLARCEARLDGHDGDIADLRKQVKGPPGAPPLEARVAELEARPASSAGSIGPEAAAQAAGAAGAVGSRLDALERRLQAEGLLGPAGPAGPTGAAGAGGAAAPLAQRVAALEATLAELVNNPAQLLATAAARQGSGGVPGVPTPMQLQLRAMGLDPATANQLAKLSALGLDPLVWANIVRRLAATEQELSELLRDPSRMLAAAVEARRAAAGGQPSGAERAMLDAGLGPAAVEQLNKLSVLGLDPLMFADLIKRQGDTEADAASTGQKVSEIIELISDPPKLFAAAAAVKRAAAGGQGSAAEQRMLEAGLDPTVVKELVKLEAMGVDPLLFADVVKRQGEVEDAAKRLEAEAGGRRGGGAAGEGELAAVMQAVDGVQQTLGKLIAEHEDTKRGVEAAAAAGQAAAAAAGDAAARGDALAQFAEALAAKHDGLEAEVRGLRVSADAAAAAAHDGASRTDDAKSVQLEAELKQLAQALGEVAGRFTAVERDLAMALTSYARVVDLKESENHLLDRHDQIHDEIETLKLNIRTVHEEVEQLTTAMVVAAPNITSSNVLPGVVKQSIFTGAGTTPSRANSRKDFPTVPPPPQQ